MNDIKRLIKEVNFESFCEPLEGDCAEVAMTLIRFFDGDSIVAVYEPTENKYPTHATAKINGSLYDGMGKTNIASLEDFVNDIKSKNLPSGVNTPDEKSRYIKQELICEIEPRNFPFEAPERYMEKMYKCKE